MSEFMELFMLSFAAGLIFALVYEVLRIIRVFFPFKAVVFVSDVLFFIIAGFAVVRLSVSLGNYIRGCIVLGFGAGIFAYVTTIGRILNLFENAVAGAVWAVLTRIAGLLIRTYKKCFGFIAHNASALFGKIAKLSAIAHKKHSRVLKKDTQLVYNKKRLIRTDGGSESGHVIIAKVRKGVNS